MVILTKILMKLFKIKNNKKDEDINYIIDKRNKKIKIFNNEIKIISLVPSHTEILCNLNLTNNIIGVTKYCIEPSFIMNRCVFIYLFRKLLVHLKQLILKKLKNYHLILLLVILKRMLNNKLKNQINIVMFMLDIFLFIFQ